MKSPAEKLLFQDGAFVIKSLNESNILIWFKYQTWSALGCPAKNDGEKAKRIKQINKTFANK